MSSFFNYPQWGNANGQANNHLQLNQSFNQNRYDSSGIGLSHKDKFISKWETAHCISWLDSISFSRYSRQFQDNDMTGEILLDCDNATLRDDIKIESAGNRRKLLKMIDKLRKVEEAHNAQELAKEVEHEALKAKVADLEIMYKNVSLDLSCMSIQKIYIHIYIYIYTILVL